MRKYGLGSCFIGVLVLVWGGFVHADTGVSDSRVSLPGGPGSIDGVGDNVEMDPNMGSMRYNVSVPVPAGFGAVTPGVSIGYNSAGGASIVGMGWSFAQPSIERSTSRRLPLYTTEDFFAANGGNELVYISGTQVVNPPCSGGRVYRSRIEGSFTRYIWCNHSDTSSGQDYWIAEASNGGLEYYGADRFGSSVPNARLGKNDSNTFRYHLVDSVDLVGHHMTYTYEKDTVSTTAHPYMKSIAWNFTPSGDELEGDTARFGVSFGYEPRADNMADCKGGFEDIMSKRLAEILVKVDGTMIRKYTLTYEDDSITALSGGFTRLKKVERYGRDGTKYPVVFGFEYAAARN